MVAARQSAGLLLYRRGEAGPEVLLAHPGGPFFRNRDEGAWSIPKGEVEPGDDLLSTARREFAEETGAEVEGEPVALGSVRQRGGKVVYAWALEGEYDDSVPPPSNTFELEWPPRSGKLQRFPEIDRCCWLDLETARTKINSAQAAFLDRLVAWLAPPE